MIIFIRGYVMKSKGFTLAELIAVIAILAVLMLLASGIFINVQRSVLESQYENIVIDIENKAEEYAMDIGTTEALYINVEFLITNGYLQADDGDNIYDPRDNTSMNCFMIHVYFENGEYIAELLENELNEDGTCNETNLDTGQITILCNGVECQNTWSSEDIVLTISGISEEELLNSTVEWTSLLGTYVYQGVGEEKELTISPNTVLNTTYNITIRVGIESYNLSKTIRIDKESPVLISRELEIDYSGNQNLSIEASDMSGSGLLGYAITNGDCATAEYTSGVVPVTGSGDLRICLKDNAGNISYEDIHINEVTFNYNDISNTTTTEVPVYFLDEDINHRLLEPERNGYEFREWVDGDGNRIYSFEDLEDGDEINATWDIIDVTLPVDKIDKDTVGVLIENKINMILVLDVSGSMGGSNLNNLKQVSRNLVNNMSFEVGSTISIISFTSGASIRLRNGTNASTAINVINSLSASGGTSFSAALSSTYSLLARSGYAKDETFVIFVSDGYGGSPGSYASRVRNMVNTVYSIGIGSADMSTLSQISSPGCYFNSSQGLSSLSEIFTRIQEEIREEITINSVNGLIELPNLYVTTEYPFILNVSGGNEDANLTFPSISSISDILTVVDGVYYLDLVKVDNKYKLGGNVNLVNFTYYYE